MEMFNCNVRSIWELLLVCFWSIVKYFEGFIMCLSFHFLDKLCFENLMIFLILFYLSALVLMLFLGYCIVREMTPCSSIRDLATAVTPGSTTRSSYSIAGHRRMQNPMPQNFPTDCEMEEFFMGLEKLQQQIFIEKYTILHILLIS